MTYFLCDTVDRRIHIVENPWVDCIQSGFPRNELERRNTEKHERLAELNLFECFNRRTDLVKKRFKTEKFYCSH